MKKHLILMLCILIFGACEKSKDIFTSSSEKPVVVIGNDKYYQKDIIEFIYFELPDIDPSTLKDRDFKKQMINEFIKHKLLLMEAKKAKLTVDKKALMDIASKLTTNNAPKGIDKKYEKLMEEKLLAKKFFEDKIKSEIKISEEELKSYYEEFVKTRQSKVYYHIYQIINEDKHKIEEAYKLLKSGKSFEDVAKEYSTGPEAENGGDMGIVDIENFPPVFDMVKNMKPNELSKIVTSEYGYHIILLKETISSDKPSFEEIKDLLLDELIAEKKDQYLENYLKEKMKDVKVEINPDFDFAVDNSTTEQK
ncbi:MAG: peptidylprolyl isomerase [Calditerrivibrio sp.]|uniref:peptidylprolyl isomerase n=1 Tax=Calditerrivibrio sp. TaxID=2792612 RepID=UPI003D09CB3D